MTNLPRAEVYKVAPFVYRVYLQDNVEGRPFTLTDSPWPTLGRKRAGRRASALLRDYVAYKKRGEL